MWSWNNRKLPVSATAPSFLTIQDREGNSYQLGHSYNKDLVALLQEMGVPSLD